MGMNYETLQHNDELNLLDCLASSPSPSAYMAPAKSNAPIEW